MTIGMYLLLTALAITLLSSLSFLKLYTDKKVDNKKLIEKNEKLKIGLNENILKLNLREGFYTDTIKFAENQDAKETDDYDAKVYVKELEKYTNGYSKIEHIRTDVYNGFSQNKYDMAKRTIQNKFESVVKTSDITWLEVDDDINKLRKEKILTLLKENE